MVYPCSSGFLACGVHSYGVHRSDGDATAYGYSDRHSIADSHSLAHRHANAFTYSYAIASYINAEAANTHALRGPAIP